MIHEEVEKINLGFDGDEYHYQGDTMTCPDCGGQMEWCEGCQMYSKTCCEEYGTCMCS